MGIFDDKEAREKIAALENKLQEINNVITSVKEAQEKQRLDIQEASKRAPEYEVEARDASLSAIEFRDKAKNSLSELESIKDDLIEFDKTINQSKIQIESKETELNNNLEKAKNLSVELENEYSNISSGIDSLKKKISDFQQILDEHPNLEDEIDDFEEIIAKIKENEAKSIQLTRAINIKKIELDTLYNKIIGYSETDDEGNEEFVEGLKQELEKSYEGFSSKLESLQGEFNDLQISNKDKFEEFYEQYSNNSNSLLKDWETRYTNLNKKIEALLPNALTAGLSYAFSEKKTEETKSHDGYKVLFQWGIAGLIIVSIIPFAISCYSIYHEVKLDIVINRLPKIVVAILPLYVPILWFTISASKKMNLSKRLIEEYTHKEVLSKTYEGLSKQIENLDGDDDAADLKTKLLQNFLLMYSENPGKLISDYNKSDHPVLVNYLST